LADGFLSAFAAVSFSLGLSTAFAAGAISDATDGSACGSGLEEGATFGAATDLSRERLVSSATRAVTTISNTIARTPVLGSNTHFHRWEWAAGPA